MMTKSATTEERLRAENKTLRARLSQAEDLVRALHGGEVDALLVTSAAGEQLVALQGADEVYRKLVEEMFEGALLLTAHGITLYANRSFAEMLKTPLEQVIGGSIERWLAPDQQRILASMLAADGDAARRCELRLSAPDGTELPIYISVTRMVGGLEPDLFCLVATDLREQKENAAKIAGEQLAQELLVASEQSRQLLQRVVDDKTRAEVKTEHVNRALANLVAVNRELVHVRNEDELLQHICQAIVGQQAYVMSWVGYVQHDEQQSIKVMASAGHDEGYLDAVCNVWGAGERGMGPSGRAVRSATTQLCQEIASDPLFLPWREAALQRGYLACIALPLLDAQAAVFGVLHVYAAEVNAFVPAEVMLLEEMSADLTFGVEAVHIRLERDLAWKKNEQHVTQLEKNLEDTVRAIAIIVEMRDPYTSGHQVRVAALAAAIAGEMGLPAQEVHAIHLAGLLHDVGKTQVPAEILSKPGKISAIEYSLIKVHSQAGYDILKGIEFPWPIAQMVLQHHELMDGSGYPQGLRGEQILLGARILCVADVVEAMSSHRPYRSALGIDAALEEITRLHPSHFDGRVADACLTLFRQRGYVLPA